jgi:hypothetical protein
MQWRRHLLDRLGVLVSHQYDWLPAKFFLTNGHKIVLFSTCQIRV